jgi:hypothetical protein
LLKRNGAAWQPLARFGAGRKQFFPFTTTGLFVSLGTLFFLEDSNYTKPCLTLVAENTNKNSNLTGASRQDVSFASQGMTNTSAR